MEREIAKLEEQLAELDKQCELHSSDYQKLMELGDERTALEQQLEALYLTWEELSE